MIVLSPVHLPRRYGAAIAYEEDQRSVLQFTGLDSFLVRGLAVGLGSSLHTRNLLESTSAVLGEHNTTGRSRRLYCQLDKESNPSLRHYRATISHRRYFVSAFRCTNRSHRGSHCVAVRCPWNRDRVSPGMEICEAFIMKALPGL